MSEITWYQKARLRAIETLSYWRGRINTRDLMEIFGVSRVIALRDIHQYMEKAPDNLEYQGSEKAFFVTPSFTNQLTSGLIDEWMEFNSNISEYVKKPQFDIKPEISRPIIDAIKKECGVSIYYRSMEHPEGMERLIFPHTLVYSGFRWHIRAWCTSRNEFRDFNISRISQTFPPTVKKPPESFKKEDSLWSKKIDIHLIANPKLSDLERSLIETEFNIDGEHLSITTRAALVMYTLQIYQVDLKNNHTGNYKQRLVLANLDDVASYIW